MAASFGNIRSGRERLVWYSLSYGILILISIATVVPFLFMISTSFTESFTMMSLPPVIIPENPSLRNYYEIIFEFQGGLFPRWFLNTVFTTAAITGGGLLLNTLSGYIFAKKQFYGRDIVFAIILATLMVPNAVTLIPAFLMVNKLGLFNTYWALIIPGLSSAFGIFMMRQYISSLPTELIESAKMDGASELRIFWSIIIPLSLPGMAALGIFIVMNAWNAFVWPLVVLRSNEMHTLVVGLATVRSEYNINYGLVMAGSMLTVLPLLLLYIAFQPYFVEGLRLGYGK
jgi:multiple sugar transport system permease protein